MHIELFFIVVTAIVTVLLIWFKTDAFYEYSKIFNIKCFFEEYENTQPTITYPQYLFINRQKISKNNKCIIFLIKLITCPFCSGFWLCMLGSIVLGDILTIFPLYIAVLFIYGVFSNILYK